MKTKKQVKKIFGDGGKVSAYKAKDEKDYKRRKEAYLDSLSLHKKTNKEIEEYKGFKKEAEIYSNSEFASGFSAFKNKIKPSSIIVKSNDEYGTKIIPVYKKPVQKILPPEKKSEVKQKEVKKSEQVKQDIPKSKKDTIAPNRPYGQMIGSKGTVDEKGKVTWDRPATAKEKAEAKKTPKMGNGGKVTKKKKK